MGFASETGPPRARGGDPHPQQRAAARGVVDQPLQLARGGLLPPQVLPALPAPHQGPVAAREWLRPHPSSSSAVRSSSVQPHASFLGVVWGN